MSFILIMPRKSKSQKAGVANITKRWELINESRIVDNKGYLSVEEEEYESDEAIDTFDEDGNENLFDITLAIDGLKSMKWRQAGFNTNKRGCGSSRSTYYRGLAKTEMTESAAMLIFIVRV